VPTSAQTDSSLREREQDGPYGVTRLTGRVKTTSCRRRARVLALRSVRLRLRNRRRPESTEPHVDLNGLRAEVSAVPTSKKDASKAGKLLGSKHTSKNVKSVAASDLARTNKPAKKKK
jgi:hypothetical protein